MSISNTPWGIAIPQGTTAGSLSPTLGQTIQHERLPNRARMRHIVLFLVSQGTVTYGGKKDSQTYEQKRVP
jgi:hypothetical protein